MAGRTRARSLTSGTKLIATKDKNISFTPDEIKDIIQTCVQANVRELEIGDLYVQFGRPAELDPVPPSKPQPEMAISDEKHDAMTADSILFEEFREKQRRLDMLAIEDPAEFERQIADGELLDDDESGEPGEE